ncbi:MAG: hypothetical protein WBZ36_10895 [Candidatus Nitrosopolaris sp.]
MPRDGLLITFIAKVVSAGENRYSIIFPKGCSKDGKRLKGKYIRAILEEVSKKT